MAIGVGHFFTEIDIDPAWDVESSRFTCNAIVHPYRLDG